jgi:Fe-S cluster assembly scaffold protein SufB
MLTGYWNGQPTAQFEGVTYEVTHIERTPLHWQNSLVGTRRQGLRIEYEGHTWYIDNENGEGFYKLTEGKGMWTSGHKSVENPVNVILIPDSDIKKMVNGLALRREREKHDDWMKEKYPQEFKRVLALREEAKKHQSKKPE